MQDIPGLEEASFLRDRGPPLATAPARHTSHVDNSWRWARAARESSGWLDRLTKRCGPGAFRFAKLLPVVLWRRSWDGRSMGSSASSDLDPNVLGEFVWP
eukprot:8412934-Pyramimonas_sp.AAC.1